MIEEINKDLVNYISLHDEKKFKMGLFDEWYATNFLNLAIAIKKEQRLKLTLDVGSFSEFEKYCKKIFLLTDIVIIRDIVKREIGELNLVFLPINDIHKKEYGFDLNEAPPILIAPPNIEEYYWTSSKTILNNGLEVPVASKFSSFFSEQVYEWAFGQGKDYLETGQIIYAPFIPSLQTEYEFINQGFSLPQSFNIQSCYFHDYNWINTERLKSLLFLKLPTMENIDISTLNKIKRDNYDEFKSFSTDLLSSLEYIKSIHGSDKWFEEIEYIQRNKIDDNIDKINSKLKSLEKMRTLRKLGYLIGAIGLNISTYLGFSHPLISLAGGASMAVSEAIKRLKENDKLQENPYYFLWKISNIK